MSLCEDRVVLFGSSLIFVALKVKEGEEDEGLYCVTVLHLRMSGPEIRISAL